MLQSGDLLGERCELVIRQRAYLAGLERLGAARMRVKADGVHTEQLIGQMKARHLRARPSSIKPMVLSEARWIAYSARSGSLKRYRILPFLRARQRWIMRSSTTRAPAR